MEPNEGCYDEVKVVVEACKTNAVENCTETARTSCLDAFHGMVGRLSDDAKDDFLGIDSAVLSMIEPREEVQNSTLSNNETNLSNETASSNQTNSDTPSQISLAVSVPFDVTMASISGSLLLGFYFCR